MLECCLQAQETDGKFVWFSMVGSSCEHSTELTAEFEGLCLLSKVFGCFYNFEIYLLQEFANVLTFGQILLQWRAGLGWTDFLFWYSATGCLQTVLLLILWLFPGWITDSLGWEDASGNHLVHSPLLQPQLDYSHDWSSSMQKSDFLGSNRFSCTSICASCLFSCHRKLPRRVWICLLTSPLDKCTSYIYEILLSLLCSRLNSHNSPRLYSYVEQNGIICVLKGNNSDHLAQLPDQFWADQKCKHVIKVTVQRSLKHWQAWGTSHLEEWIDSSQ